jgi:hypothetical protein
MNSFLNIFFSIKNNSFFREKKELFFADSKFVQLGNNVETNTKDKKELKESKKDEKIIIESSKVRTDVKNLLKKTIDGDGQSLKKVLVLKNDKSNKDLLNDITKSFSSSEQTKLQEIIEISKENETKDIECIIYLIRLTNKPFDKNHIKILSEVPLLNILKVFSYEGDRKNFFKNFINLSNSLKIPLIKDWYDFLDIELSMIIESDDLKNSEKKIIFEKYIKIKALKERKKFEEVATETIEEKNIQDTYIYKNFHKGLWNKIKNILYINKSLEKDAEENEDKEKISLQEKEKKMFQNIACLGESVVENVKSEISKYAISDEKSRHRVFLETVNKVSISHLHEVKHLGLNKVREFIDKSKKTSLFLLSEFKGLSDLEKQIQKDELDNGYLALYEYLDVLKKSEKENSNLPVLKFFYKGIQDKKSKKWIKPFNIFTEIDGRDLFKLEKERKNLEFSLLKERRNFKDSTHIVNDLFESKEYDSYSIVEKKHALQRLNLLTENGIKEMLKGNTLKPVHLDSVSSLKHKYGFTNLDINTKIYTPLDKTLSNNVIQKILNKDIVSENVYKFMEKDRVVSGLESITSNLSSMSTDFLNDGKKFGWIEEGGENEVLKNGHEKFIDRKNMEIFLSNSKEKLETAKNLISPFAEKEGMYKTLYNNTVSKFDEMINSINPEVDPELWDTEMIKFSNLLKGFYEKNGKKSFQSIILGENNLQHMTSSMLSGLIEDIKLRINSPESYNTLATWLNKTTGFFLDIPIEDTMEKTVLQTKSKIYDSLSNFNGCTEESFLYLQKIVQNNLKNKLGINLITSFEKENISDSESIFYNKTKDQLVLSNDLYNKLLNGKWLEQDESIEDLLVKVNHEYFHSLVSVDIDDNIIESFNDKLIENNKFESFQKRAKEILKTNNYEGTDHIMEEPYAMLLGAMQIGEEKFNQIFTEENISSRLRDQYEGREDKLYGISPSMQNLVLDLKNTLGKDFISETLQTSIKNIKSTHIFGEDKKARLAPTQDLSLDDIKDLSNKDNTEENNNGKKNNEVTIEKEVEKKLATSQSRQIALGDLDKKKLLSEELLEQIEDIKDLFPSETLSNFEIAKEYFMEQYNETKHDIINALYQDDLNNVLEKYDNNVIKKIQNYITTTASKNIEKPNRLLEFWDNTIFLSTDNIKNLTVKAWEYIKRLYSNTSTRNEGEAGYRMMKGNLNGLANEFKQSSDSKIDEEIGTLKKGIELKSDEGILDYMQNEVDSKYTFDAAIQVLSSKGLIRWDQPVVINGTEIKDRFLYAEILTKLGAGVNFYKSDFNYDNERTLNSKLRTAFNNLFNDTTYFDNIFNQNTSAISSKINEAKNSAGSLKDVPEQLKEYLQFAHEGGYVSSNEYEGYVQFMIGDGTTNPAHYMYYLLMGIKEGITTRDAVQRFYAFSSEFPPSDEIRRWDTDKIIDFCDRVLKGKKDGTEAANDSPSWGAIPPSFIPLVHKEIMTSDATVERTVINMSTGKNQFDQDNAHLLASIGDPVTAYKYLAGTSTGADAGKPTMFSQSILGIVQNISSIGLYDASNDIEFDKVKETVRRQAGYFATFYTTGFEASNDGRHFNFSPSFLKTQPRSGDDYNRDMNTGDYLNSGKAIFSSVKNPILKDLCDNWIFSEKFHKNPKKFVEEWNRLYEQYSLDFIFGEKPELKENQGGQVATILDTLFTYFFTESEDADENVKSIANAAANMAKGNGIEGLEGSEKFKYETLFRDASNPFSSLNITNI